MENPPSIEEVLRGVHALYDNPDLKEKDKASLWLAELQKSVSEHVFRSFGWILIDFSFFFSSLHRYIRGKLPTNCCRKNTTSIHAILQLKP